MKRTIGIIFLLATVILPVPAAAATFDANSPAGAPSGCPALAREEAADLLGGLADNVVGILPGPVEGTWEVDLAIGGKVYPVYLDCSRKYLLQGQILRLSDKENITRNRFEELNRVDVSSIPLKNAVVLGDRSSKRRIIVLTDPSCPYCVKLHGAIKEAVAKDPEAAFFILPYPRNPNDKAVYERCLAAVCDKSGKTLDDVYAGKDVPPPTCKSEAVDQTIRLAERLQVRGTPSLILPDGRVVSGYRDAEELLKLTGR